MSFLFSPSQLRKNTSKAPRPPVTFSPNLETENHQQNGNAGLAKEKSLGKLSKFFGLKRSKSSSDEGGGVPDPAAGGGGGGGGGGGAGVPSSTMLPGRSALASRSVPSRHRYPREAGLLHQSQLIDPNQVGIRLQYDMVFTTIQ